jgi:hypothetical protein
MRRPARVNDFLDASFLDRLGGSDGAVRSSDLSTRLPFALVEARGFGAGAR